jgi:hypothetical protein
MCAVALLSKEIIRPHQWERLPLIGGRSSILECLRL